MSIPESAPTPEAPWTQAVFDDYSYLVGDLLREQYDALAAEFAELLTVTSPEYNDVLAEYRHMRTDEQEEILRTAEREVGILLSAKFENVEHVVSLTASKVGDLLTLPRIGTVAAAEDFKTSSSAREFPVLPQVAGLFDNPSEELVHVKRIVHKTVRSAIKEVISQTAELTIISTSAELLGSNPGAAAAEEFRSEATAQLNNTFAEYATSLERVCRFDETSPNQRLARLSHYGCAVGLEGKDISGADIAAAQFICKIRGYLSKLHSAFADTAALTFYDTVASTARENHRNLVLKNVRDGVKGRLFESLQSPTSILQLRARALEAIAADPHIDLKAICALALPSEEAPSKFDDGEAKAVNEAIAQLRAAAANELSEDEAIIELAFASDFVGNRCLENRTTELRQRLRREAIAQQRTSIMTLIGGTAAGEVVS